MMMMMMMMILPCAALQYLALYRTAVSSPVPYCPVPQGQLSDTVKALQASEAGLKEELRQLRMQLSQGEAERAGKDRQVWQGGRAGAGTLTCMHTPTRTHACMHAPSLPPSLPPSFARMHTHTCHIYSLRHGTHAHMPRLFPQAWHTRTHATSVPSGMALLQAQRHAAGCAPHPQVV